MADYNSANISFEERASESPQRLINTRLKGGAILPSNDGPALTPINISNDTDVFDLFGNPNDYNYMYHKQITDFSTPGNPMVLIRPLPVTAKNADLQLRGITHKKLDAWYLSTSPRNLIRQTEKFYNSDMAEISLNYDMTTEYKLDIIRKYVSTKQDIAVAVCSSIKNFDEPIFNANIDVIRNINAGYPSNNPTAFEKYTIRRLVTGASVTTKTAKTFVIAGDYSSATGLVNHKFTAGDKYIVSGTNTGTFTVVTSVYASPSTTITVIEEPTSDSTNDIIHFLGGSWSTKDTFIDGSLVEYSGSTWGLVAGEPSEGSKYYIELLGAAYQRVGSTWIKLTDESYIPIDINNDGKADIAQLNIFSTELLTSSGILVSFNDLVTNTISFENNEIVIVVLKKNMVTNKWGFGETIIGNYLSDHIDINGKSDFIENVTYTTGKYIYAKVGHKLWTPTSITTSTLVFASLNLSHIQVGETIILTDYLENAVPVLEKRLTVSNVVFAAGDTTITFVQTLTVPTLVGSSKMSDIIAGKVSTNRNYYMNKFDSRYNISNTDASDGFTLNNMIVYDIAPVDGSSVTITDYSNLDNDDFDTSADLFRDKDNIDVGLLLSYETLDEFGVRKQNRMAEIAMFREQCLALLSPWNISLFDFSDKDITTQNIIDQYGNNRSNKYSGIFTKFSTYSRVDANMKYDYDTYNKKYRWYPITGDIGAKISSNSDNANRGAEYPIAGINGGELQNQIKLAFIPNFEQRELLAKNGINFVYQGKSSSTPIIFSNFTTYDLPVPAFTTSSYRMLFNTVETWIENNLFPRYFKYKTTDLKAILLDAFNSYISQYITRGSVYSSTWSYPVIKNENPKNLTIEVSIVVNPVIESFKVLMNLSEKGITFTEIPA